MITKPPHFLLYSESTSRSLAKSTATPEASPDEPDGFPARGWHFILRSIDGSTELDVSDEEQESSDERLELLAVVRGLEALDQPSRVTLVTSSSWIRRGLRFGLDFWRENRWQWERFGRMAPVKNADLWRRIDRALEFHEVECRSRQRTNSSDDLAPQAPAAVVERPDRQRRRDGALPAAGSDADPKRREPLVRRMFSWCGMCRSDPSLVIAAH